MWIEGISLGGSMASRSMAGGCGAKILGWVAVLCIYLGSSSGSDALGIRHEEWSWVYAIPWAIAALALGRLSRSAAKRSVSRRQEKENEKAVKDGLPFMVMLRPFSVDNRLSIENPDKGRFVFSPSSYYEEETIPINRLLAQAVRSELHLRAIGGDPIGPGVVKVDDSEWRDSFFSLIRDARGIIMVVLPGREIPWELRQLRLHGCVSKTIFLLPPLIGSEKLAAHADEAWFAEQLRADGFHLPGRDSSFIVFRLSESGEVVEKHAFPHLDFRSLREILRKVNLTTFREEEPLPGLRRALTSILLAVSVAASLGAFRDVLGIREDGDGMFWISAAAFTFALLSTALSFSVFHPRLVHDPSRS